MAKDKGRQRLPPYVSYRTFQNFLEGLQNGVPSRIDRSYWSDRLSGSTGTQLMSALRFLRLIDANNVPTSQLKSLAQASGGQRAEMLKQVAAEAFSFLMQGTLDLQSSTYAQLQEAFDNTFELTDGVSRKCVKFFVEMANAAGIPLSPFISKRLRTARSSSGTKIVPKKVEGRVSRKVVVPQQTEEVPFQTPWERMLLAKFPTFDPTWTDEVKLKWFEAFDKLLGCNLPKDRG
jgi:hypothetical protein